MIGYSQRLLVKESVQPCHSCCLPHNNIVEVESTRGGMSASKRKMSTPRRKMSPSKRKMSTPKRKMSQKPKMSPPKPKMSLPNPNMSPPNPNTSSPNPDTSSPDPNMSLLNPDKSPPNPNMSSLNPNTSPPNRKLTTLSIDQKIEILNILKLKAKTRKELSREYGCNLSTIVRIIQNEAKIRNVVLENGNTARKRLRKGHSEEIDEAVTVWFHQMRAKNVVVSGPMVQEEAKKFAEKLGFPNFLPTNSWLGRWKAKENVAFLKLQGGNGSTGWASAEEWIKKVMPTLLAEYEAKDIYNADEAGLFYKALPDKGDNPEGGRTQKDRLTALFMCNMDGTDKRVFVVGRWKKPHCFRGKKLPLPYFDSTKAWMTGSLWTKVILDFDSEMTKQNRKVLLFADNAPCHKLEEGVVLQSVKIQLHPANTTSIIQPLDQGIIRDFKVRYRREILRQQSLAVEKGLPLQEFTKTISAFDALKIIEQSWGSVTPGTIRNCFRKAGFVKGEESVGEDEEVQIKVECEPFQFPEDEFEGYVDCDTALECYGELTADDIAEEVRQQRDRDEEEAAEDKKMEVEVKVEEEGKALPTREEALSALSIVRAYLENKNEFLDNVSALEDQFEDMTAVYVVQKRISDCLTVTIKEK